MRTYNTVTESIDSPGESSRLDRSPLILGIYEIFVCMGGDLTMYIIGLFRVELNNRGIIHELFVHGFTCEGGNARSGCDSAGERDTGDPMPKTTGVCINNATHRS